MAAGAISLGAMSVLPAAAAPTAAFAEEAAPAAASQTESFVSDGSPEELRKQLEDAGKLRPGMRVMLMGFGVGLSWGATIVTI